MNKRSLQIGLATLLITPVRAQSGAETVDWGGVLRQSAFMVGIQHGFRLATEAQTRDGLKGPYFQGWYQSLANLHGWADGDPFLVNYVGHPLQGAASGYIWVQNDGNFRKAEFGRNELYWKSRLRATLWSWAYSTQFEIGPISEASIGKIQARYPQQGFVDHVATPSIGLAWMVAEDALDRYVIRAFEHRVDNFYLRMMVRGWLNPARSFANLMRWKEPWYRNTRTGIGAYRRSDLSKSVLPSKPRGENPEPWRQAAPFEFSYASAYLVNPAGKDALHCIGGLGSAKYNFSQHWAWVAEVGGCKMFGFQGSREFNYSGDILTYGTGLRYNYRFASGSRLLPYAQVLVGGKRITIDEEIPALKQAWQDANRGRRPGYELHGLWTRTNQANGFAVQVGGGLDIGLTKYATLRLAGFDYNHAWLPRTELAAYPHTVRVQTGITIRMGNW